MIKHIVMWKFKEGVNEAQKQEMKRQLEALPALIPCVKELEIGLDVSAKEASMDMVLYSVFDTAQDLIDYAIHPEHLSVVEYVKTLVSERRVVDYEV